MRPVLACINQITAQEPPFDLPRAMALMEGFKAGETPNADGAAYLGRVRKGDSMVSRQPGTPMPQTKPIQ